jgi:mRNA interferase RelE/StbE
MRYRVVLPKSVQKIMDRLPDEIVKRILVRLAGLETNPRPPDVKKLKGRNAWRIRVGEYRVIYEIHDRELRVLVITIGHRGDVYR